MREAVDYDVEDFERPDARKGVNARFYYVPKKNEAQSAAEGRPVFEDKEYVELIAAGNSTNIIRRPIYESDKRLYREEYKMFKSGDEEQIVGTRLTEIPWLTRSQVEELMYRKIRTLEGLADVSDHDCNIPGMLDLRRKAQAWLDKAKEAAPFTAMQAEMEAMRAELAALKAQQGAQVNEKAAPQGKKG
jgi:hypothetical protein